MLNKFKEMLEDIAKEGETMFARFADKNDFERVVFASYLIAIADGNFDSDEKTALARLIEKDFKQFKLTDIIEVLDDAKSKTDFDVTMGTSELLGEIGKAKGDTAGLIVRTAAFIGASDGDFDADEKAMTVRIANALKLNPADYGL